MGARMAVMVLGLGLATAARADEDAQNAAEPPADSTAEEPRGTPAPPPPPERPLALPGAPRRPGQGPGAGGPRGGPPPARGGMDVDHYKALRQYQRKRLAIRGETRREPGTTYVFGTGGGYWRWGGWHTATVVHDPGTITRTWGVYRGPERLDVPTFLQMVGQQDLADDVSRRVRRARTAGKVWLTGAGIGAAGLVAGIVGTSLADTADEVQTWSSVTLGGSLLAVGGLVGATFPMGKANRLAADPAASVSWSEAQDWVDAYNDQLREELGLSPEEAWRIESRGGRDR